MDYNERQTLKLILNELELIGIKFNLDLMDRAIYNDKVVYILTVGNKYKVFNKEEKKVYEVNRKELIQYPLLKDILNKLPFRSQSLKFEGFLTFVKQKSFNQDLVILALNYLLCIKKNSIGLNGVLIDCNKKDNKNKTKKRRKL